MELQSLIQSALFTLGCMAAGSLILQFARMLKRHYVDEPVRCAEREAKHERSNSREMHMRLVEREQEMARMETLHSEQMATSEKNRASLEESFSQATKLIERKNERLLNLASEIDRKDEFIQLLTQRCWWKGSKSAWE